uniref:Signal transducer and activator of transcription n=1 Tax=Nothobranchius rachovii TaxID=451742 RepID=A0A1A8NZM7_9TELE
MARWVQIEHLLRLLASDQRQDLYSMYNFPIEARYYLRDWIQIQRWEEFAPEKRELEGQARVLLNQAIKGLEEAASHINSEMDKIKLKQIRSDMANYQPLQFAVTVKEILMQEKVLMEELLKSNNPQHQMLPQSDPNSEDVGRLKERVKELQVIRKNMHHMQEELNWEKQNYESLQGFQLNGVEHSQEVKKLISNIQKMESCILEGAQNAFRLLSDCVDSLERSQAQFINRVKTWLWDQHKAAIGHPFDDNLNPLQTWCEHLLGLNWDLSQEVMLMEERLPKLQERLGNLLQVLVKSSFVVEKQPPQVIKTQSKFRTIVRCLLGDKLAPGKPTMVKAQIVNEQQARNLGSISSSENVGDVINNAAVLEHNTSTKCSCATFRNMCIKRIRRADRKGSESVTEEKFALLFSTEISITGCDTSFKIQWLSQPVVIIVHGSQDNNALATIIWDCAFAEQDRRPFVVPDSVPWRLMFNTLNLKFTSEVQTEFQMTYYNKHCLAEKIFDTQSTTEIFDDMMVSWAQFNKEMLPGRPFTFWQWFEGAIELTKKHLKPYWSEQLIFGFIGKQHLHNILKNSPGGTFLLRFSDSEIGGISIAYVVVLENGVRQIQNIQPFTKRDLEIRSLGNRLRDICEILYLYPGKNKFEAFKKFFTVAPQQADSGYIPVTLTTKVGTESTLPAANIVPQPNNPTGFILDAISPSNIQPMDGIAIDDMPSTDLPDLDLDPFQQPLGVLGMSNPEHSSNSQIYEVINYPSPQAVDQLRVQDNTCSSIYPGLTDPYQQQFDQMRVDDTNPAVPPTMTIFPNPSFPDSSMECDLFEDLNTFPTQSHPRGSGARGGGHPGQVTSPS